ncbi:MAG: UDP-N-acetylmuramoyl-tripeptide--D-alanyl-D-alanine ligase [Candidatus Tectomicrobia bacterium]|uniref:UDP-N-acetylmuramoyl-tripeptide--D-alanyl-D-alanine ligase n=1 Tax=Tectimicrobiota bacterium TaxID=2528274 RepID=A0A938B1T6_UNCTE|nr:UDP-N-acetylmuramoyl-tripeptide--D-alanyl-D-alanine ligase [Candidatus Tectomicrobia bacterium]
MMPTWNVTDIVQHTQGTLLWGDAQRQVRGVSTDSRTVPAGALFIALRGERFDGHQFVGTALQQGAAAVLVADRQSVETVPMCARSSAGILVTDTEQALQDLARAQRQQFTGTVIGITGSNGKTSVKEMTAAVLQQHYVTWKAAGNLNNHIGVPLTLLQLEATHQVAVLEMGMNHLGEIRHLCAIARPNIGVLTNIGLAHVGYLGSIERIQQAKGELIESLDATSVAIVNADDPRTLALGQQAAGRLLTFGQGPEADIRGWLREDRGLDGLACTLMLDGMACEVLLPVLGAHQLSNALAAAAVGVALHVPAPAIVAGLQSYRGMYGRMMVKRGQHGVTLLDDTYNASPQSTQAALQCLAQTQSPGRRVAVLGDMLELGEQGPSLHTAIGALVAHSGVHYLITFGALAQHIAQGARNAGMAAACIHSTTQSDEAITLLTALQQPGDVILLKGSRGMAMERLVHALAAHEGSS